MFVIGCSAFYVGGPDWCSRRKAIVYIGAGTDTTQQSGQIPDKEVEINHITVYVSGYTETDPTGILSSYNSWQSGQIPAADGIGF